MVAKIAQISSASVLGFLILSALPAEAQFPGGFGGLAGMRPQPQSVNSGTGTVLSPGDIDAQYSSLNLKFFHALREMLVAQSFTLAALGEKARAGELSTEASSLEGKNDIGTVDRSIQISQDASVEINNKMAASSSIDSKSKEILAQAIPHYGIGLLTALQLPHEYQLWISSAQQTAHSMQGNPMQALRAPRLFSEIKTVTAVTLHMPDLIGTWSSTTGNFIKFSHRNNVDTGDLSSKI